MTAMLTDIGDVSIYLLLAVVRYTYCTALLKFRGAVTHISEKNCSDGNE